MPKYHITMTQHTTWEFELEADSEEHAFELTAEWGRDEMEENEITDNCWETGIDEVE